MSGEITDTASDFLSVVADAINNANVDVTPVPELPMIISSRKKVTPEVKNKPIKRRSLWNFWVPRKSYVESLPEESVSQIISASETCDTASLAGSCILEDHTLDSPQSIPHWSYENGEMRYPSIPGSLVASSNRGPTEVQHYKDEDEITINLIMRFNDDAPIHKISEIRSAALVFLASLEMPSSTKVILAVCMLDRSTKIERSKQGKNVFNLNGTYSLGSFQAHAGGEYRNVSAWAYVARGRSVVPIYGMLTTKMVVNKSDSRAFPPMDGLTYMLSIKDTAIMDLCDAYVHKGKVYVDVTHGFDFERFAYSTAAYCAGKLTKEQRGQAYNKQNNGLFLI